MKSKIRVRASEHRPQRRRADAPPAPAGSPGRCPSPAVRASRARPLRPAPAVLLAWAARPLASSCLSFGVVYKAMFVLTSGDVAVQTRADGRRAGHRLLAARLLSAVHAAGIRALRTCPDQRLPSGSGGTLPGLLRGRGFRMAGAADGPSSDRRMKNRFSWWQF